jgi:hypothetical protein
MIVVFELKILNNHETMPRSFPWQWLVKACTIGSILNLVQLLLTELLTVQNPSERGG